MNKLARSLLIICATLLTTACNDSNQIKDSRMIDLDSSSVINNENKSNVEDDKSSKEGLKNTSKSLETINLPIILMTKDVKDEKNIKYLEINENITIQEKIELTATAISKECFNSLPIKVSVDNGDIAHVDLIEPENVKNTRVTWKDDYLNEEIKEYTISIILKNLLQENYKGEWIDKVQLYHEGELISLN
ncbi:MAG: hypothetical protein ACRDA3_11850 [Peptostreptococcaceae bacterium]